MDTSADRDRADRLPTHAERHDALVVHLAKVVRLGTMLARQLDEFHQGPISDETCTQLRPRHETAIRELAGALSADLQAELVQIAPGLSQQPSCAELRVAEAQVIGWLQGLLQAVQAEAVQLAAPDAAVDTGIVGAATRDPAYL